MQFIKKLWKTLRPMSVILPQTSIPRRDKKGSSSRASSPASAGLLAGMQAVERATRELNSLLEEIAEEEDEATMAEALASISEERAGDVAEHAEALKDGLVPLEQQVRAVFSEVVRYRGHNAHSTAGSAFGVPAQHPHSF